MIEQARRIQPQLVAWRRHLHQHPELSGQEANTAAFIAEQLRALGYDPRLRVGGGFGLTADLLVAGRPPTLALRADMDALPIHEETGLEYASATPGVMHACGHDAHVAMLLGAARLLRERRERLPQSVRFLFQPHEEKYPGGAPTMIAGGALDGIRSIFGIHICSDLPVGRLGTRPGPFMAAVNPFRIRVSGKGGHAAVPERCADPIVAAAQIVTALQTVVSRNVAPAEPAVVSVTQFHAGTADNIIPPTADLAGTIRSFSDAVRRRACERVTQIARTVAAANLAEAHVEIDDGYPVLRNDPAAVGAALAAAHKVGFRDDQIDTLPPQGGGEDFAYYAERVPAAFVFLGAANQDKDCVYPHHHPRFNIDEDALSLGAALHAAFALQPAAGAS